MASDVDLCNRALSAIGTRSTISSLNEATNEAEACLLIYASARDELLREANWSFNKGQIALTQLASSPLVNGTAQNATSGVIIWSFMPWAYEYAYPADCVKFRHILSPYGSSPFAAAPVANPPRIPFEVAADKDASGNDVKVVLTNLAQAIGVYSRAIVDPNMFDVGFEKGLVASLAKKLAVPLSGNLELAKEAIQEGEAEIAKAKQEDANEGIAVQDGTPDWIKVRGVSATYLPGPWYTYPLFPVQGS